jgi:hypothetical protein
MGRYLMKNKLILSPFLIRLILLSTFTAIAIAEAAAYNYESTCS